MCEVALSVYLPKKPYVWSKNGTALLTVTSGGPMGARSRDWQRRAQGGLAMARKATRYTHQGSIRKPGPFREVSYLMTKKPGLKVGLQRARCKLFPAGSLTCSVDGFVFQQKPCAESIRKHLTKLLIPERGILPLRESVNPETGSQELIFNNQAAMYPPMDSAQ